MDCMEAKALKSSLLSDIGVMKPSQQQGFVDDIWCVTGLNNVSCDDFSVDDLLDFSDKDFKDGPLKEDEDFKDTLSLSSSQHHHHHHHRNSNFSSFSETDDFGSLLAAELAVPVSKTYVTAIKVCFPLQQVAASSCCRPRTQSDIYYVIRN